jgi:hypothetical protein
MKDRSSAQNWTALRLLAMVAGTLASNLPRAQSAEVGAGHTETVLRSDANSPGDAARKEIVVRAVEPGESAGGGSTKEVSWLGVSTDEASEALASQLGLAPGVGLVANFVSEDSPAAKAGLQKHDVLVEFEKQSLVHPAQLRKLVHARKAGDVVELVLYRGGQKQTLSATLGKAKAGFAGFEGDPRWNAELDKLKLQLRELRIGDTVRDRMKELRESLEDLRNREDVQVEIRKGMAEAQQGVREALNQLTNLPAALAPAADMLKELTRSGVLLDKDAHVVVRSSNPSARSLVQSDESGTIVIVSNPKRRLTVHDADGKLVFDGEIETADQQDKVPRDVWKKVEPLLDKMKAEAD